MTWTQQALSEHYQRQLAQWEKVGIKAQGREELLGHFRGEDLTQRQAIAAHCYECMGGHGDGENRDCENPPCPLYPYMPYSSKRKKRVFSLEHKKKLSDSLEKVRGIRKTTSEKAKF